MRKISLNKARELLDDLVLIDVFASLVVNELAEDNKKLKLYKQLTDKIYKAEKYFGIDDIKHQIKLLDKEVHYYDPVNSVFYYKNKISEEVKVSNKSIFKELLSSIELLKNKIAEISEHVYIEVDT